MRALILCAGNGSRLGSFANGQPKPLIRLGGTSNLLRILSKLEKLGVQEVLINTHKKHEEFTRELANFSTTMTILLKNEVELLGTLGTLMLHREWLSKEPFWVLHGDNFFQSDLSEMLTCFNTLSQNLFGVMGSFKSYDYRSVGIVKTDNNGVFNKIYEKAKVPYGRNANAAIYLFNHNLIESIIACDISGIDISRDLLPILKGKLKVVPLHGFYVDIGTPKKLKKARLIAVRRAQEIT
jgi:NDP-sugar pyrophosphorylase family protein